jgi:hypothetical protein
MYLDVKIDDVPVQLEVKTVGPASLEDIDEFREKLKAGELVLINKSDVFGHLEEENVRSNPYFVESDQESAVSEEEGNHPVEGSNGGLVPVPSPIDTEQPNISDLSGNEPEHDRETAEEPHSSGPFSADPPSDTSPVSEPDKPELPELEEQDKPDILDVIEDVQEIFENNKDPEVTQGMKPWWQSKTIISNVFAALGCVFGVLVSDDPQSSMYLPASIVAFINLYLRSVSKNEIKLPMEDRIKRFGKK